MDHSHDGFYNDYYWFGRTRKSARQMMREGKKEYRASKFKIFKFCLDKDWKQ